MIINAKDLIVGRLATVAAKKALLGESVDVVNSEGAVISGKRDAVFAKYKKFQDAGEPNHGPVIPKMPDRFLRRIIKRMLPYKKPKGREAYDRIMCHIGVPDKFKDKKLETLKESNVSKIPTHYYVTVKEVCENLGGKV